MNAIYGFSRMISKVLKSDKPDYVAVCFDTATPTFRHEQYKEYKATRVEIDQALLFQLPLAEELTKVWGLPIAKKEGFEADDVIATLAVAAQKKGWEVLILSGDKDILQLVQPLIHVRDEVRGIEYDEAKVKERYGISPQQLIDYLSLMGDKVDNVKGVPGIGEKTAGALLAEYGSLENLYDRLNGSKPALREKLLQYKDTVFNNRTLVKLREDVPLSQPLETFKPEPPDQEKLAVLMKRFEFKAGLYGVEEVTIEKSWELNTKRNVHVVLTASELKNVEDNLKKAERVSYDLETDGINPRRCNIVGVSLAVRENEAFYIPIGHRYLGAPQQLPWDVVRAAIAPTLQNEKQAKLGQNIKFDNAILKRHGITVQGPQFDTMVAAYCLDASRNSYGLKDLAGDYLNERMTRIEELIGTKKDKTFVSVEVEKAASYAGADSEVVLRLAAYLSERMDKEKARTLFETLEMPLVEVIEAMETAGVRIDVDYLKEIGRQFDHERNELEKEVYALTGQTFSLNSPKQLAHVLFDVLKMPVVKKTKTGYSTDEEVLKTLAIDHPVCRKILNYRQLAKLTSTYVEALLAMADPETQRVHTSFHQTGTITGRLSSSEPNLQNIPIRTEHGRKIRKAFAAQNNCVLISADYSQIDLRALAHVSEDPALIATFEKGGDVHTATAADVFHVDVDHVTTEMRRKAKAINFGIVYGQQAFGLSQALEISVEEAQNFINRYFERYAGVKKWITEMLEKARETGVVATLAGRKRLVSDINSKNGSLRGFAERVAINTPIQGSSADIIKAAMIKVFKLLRDKKMKTEMLVQVHDELLFEVPRNETEQALALIRDGMEHAYQLRVPLVVDIKQGPNWNDMEKVK